MSETLCYPRLQTSRYGSTAPASQVTFIFLKYYWDTPPKKTLQTGIWTTEFLSSLPSYAWFRFEGFSSSKLQEKKQIQNPTALFSPKVHLMFRREE